MTSIARSNIGVRADPGCDATPRDTPASLIHRIHQIPHQHFPSPCTTASNFDVFPFLQLENTTINCCDRNCSSENKDNGDGNDDGDEDGDQAHDFSHFTHYIWFPDYVSGLATKVEVLYSCACPVCVYWPIIHRITRHSEMFSCYARTQWGSVDQQLASTDLHWNNCTWVLGKCSQGSTIV